MEELLIPKCKCGNNVVTDCQYSLGAGIWILHFRLYCIECEKQSVHEKLEVPDMEAENYRIVNINSFNSSIENKLIKQFLDNIEKKKEHDQKNKGKDN